MHVLVLDEKFTQCATLSKIFVTSRTELLSGVLNFSVRGEMHDLALGYEAAVFSILRCLLRSVTA